MSISLIVNGSAYTVDVEPETPLLWVLRDSLKLTGTKFGCGIAQCGACTVLIDGQATRSCSIAGCRPSPARPSPPSRGCRPKGRIRSNWPGSSSTFRNADTASPGRSWRRWRCSSDKPKPTDADINREMTNICRCGTYPRIRAAIHRAAELQA